MAIHTLSYPSLCARAFTTIITTGADAADAVLLGAATSFPLTLLSLSIFRPVISSAVIVGLILFSLCAVFFYVALAEWPEERGMDRRAHRRSDWRSFLPELLNSIRDYRDCQAKKRNLERVRDKLLRAELRLDEIEELLSIDIDSLSGLQFEIFLESVFLTLGYDKVVRTKASGDQGIDLVISRNGIRIAVQAKLYKNSVGNAAVQQAVAGMCYYDCDRCAVVTNSSFTRSAKDLAEANRCKLVNGTRLRRIIAGKESL